MDRKLGYQRLSKLLFRIDHLEIDDYHSIKLGELLLNFAFDGD